MVDENSEISRTSTDDNHMESVKSSKIIPQETILNQKTKFEIFFDIGYIFAVLKGQADNIKNFEGFIESVKRNYTVLKKYYLKLMDIEWSEYNKFKLTDDKGVECFLNHLDKLRYDLLIKHQEYELKLLLECGYYFSGFMMVKFSQKFDSDFKENQEKKILNPLKSLFSIFNLEESQISSSGKSVVNLLDNCNNEDDQPYIALQAKNIIIDACFKKKQKLIRSVIDKSRSISNESWVLSLARKLNGTHQEHAFLVLEGQKDNKALIWFIDLVGNPILPGMGDGKIRICPYESELTDEDLIFRCDRRMMDIRKGDRIASTSWNISTELAENLVKLVNEEKDTPPKFNILGNRSMLSIGTGFSSSVPTGHNCFTWAKEKIRNLNDPNITIIEDNLTSYIFSRTSHLLVDPQQKLTLWYQKPITIAATSAIVGGLVVANKEIIYNSCTIQ